MAKSGQGNIIYNIAKASGKRDQDYGYAVLPVPNNAVTANGTVLTTADEICAHYAPIVGAPFGGVVPLLQDWSRFGLRFKAVALAETTVKLGYNPQQAGGPGTVINSKFLVTSVPKAWRRDALVQWLSDTIGFASIILDNGCRPDAQDAELVGYLVGAVQPPRTTLLVYSDTKPGISISPFLGKGKGKGKGDGGSKSAPWATKALASQNAGPVKENTIVAMTDATAADGEEDMLSAEDDELGLTLNERLHSVGKKNVPKPKIPTVQFGGTYTVQTGGSSSSASRPRADLSLANVGGATMSGPRAAAATMDLDAKIEAIVAAKFEQQSEGTAMMTRRVTALEKSLAGVAGSVNDVRHAQAKSQRRSSIESRRHESAMGDIKRMLAALGAKAGVDLTEQSVVAKEQAEMSEDDDAASVESAPKVRKNGS